MLLKLQEESNVIPHVAEATVNFRLHPAQTVDEVLHIVRNTISDERVELSVVSAFEPLLSVHMMIPTLDIKFCSTPFTQSSLEHQWHQVSV
ncbi:N-fatty-acyl-amino acid synthase/hydrolase PM20D1-like [Hyperolius riggenbachi]|uniref:N-fatty-acyl-amino acid synthase/hydrolase PM20D1-like n=1 Tax=Hyperolius riggenbachi TaxID=752182 RepID=UPI0035A3C751